MTGSKTARIVLASASPRRRDLLNQIGLSFELFPGAIPEEIPAGARPEALARELAERKARTTAALLAGKGMEGPPPLILAADTIVVLGDDILGKPGDAAEARVMLARLAGEVHRVITGVALLEPADNGRRERFLVEHEETRVKMRPMTPAMIEAYVATGEPLDKAGAYAVQGKGSVLVERIEGCYFNVVGLPLARLARMLEGFGVRVLG